MELLLNLLWLTLALPAIWMWQHQSVCARDWQRFRAIRPFVLLGCILVLLFPVVSATDDLHAVRREMEESSPSKKVVKQATADKSLARLTAAGALPALIFPVSFGRDDTVCGRAHLVTARLPEQQHSDISRSRAPPFSSLAKNFGVAA